MAGFFQKLKGAGTANSKSDSTTSSKGKAKEKDDPALDLTPVERLLQNAGAIRPDGSDKFFGLENFGNTCYCNSILQALYYSEPFRENVLNYPSLPPNNGLNGAPKKVNVTIREPVQPNPKDPKGKALSAQAKQRQVLGGGQLAPGGVTPVRPEDRPDAPEYKKKQAMIKGPVLELAQENPDTYGMQECTFTGLKDIFTALIESQSRTGVLSPQRFLEIFKRDNEMFRNSMHQDAHEFYGLILNDVIANVEANAKRMRVEQAEGSGKDGPLSSPDTASVHNSNAIDSRTPAAGWVHDIFEGVLTSETRCLTCEAASQRDETFLDLSIDLEEHSSVTSCLQKFSAEEMLCERNKFHCDHCGGLQEAEKRMKVKKLPKVLALHLKRFKYTEDYSRLQKLFHRIVYPYHIRMFNTTDDAEDQDRLYELYAVVIHIGGNAYHGHYVSVIKTKDRGWLLFDDEMVEPVDKHFVKNFFGDKPGMACAYVLFYQETTWEKVREEMDAEGLDQVREASEAADLAATTVTAEQTNGTHPPPLTRLSTQPLPTLEENETLATLEQTKSAPLDSISPVSVLASPVKQPAGPEGYSHPLVAAPPPGSAVMTKADEAATVPAKSKEEIKKEQKMQEKAEKARKAAEKAAEKEAAKLAAKERLFDKSRDSTTEDEEEKRRKKDATTTGSDSFAAVDSPSVEKDSNNKFTPTGFFNRAGRNSKTMTRKSLAFLKTGDKDKEKDKNNADKADRSDRSDKTESRASTAAGESSSNGGHDAVLPPVPALPYLNGVRSNGTAGQNGHSSSSSPGVGPSRSDTAPPELFGGSPTKDRDGHKPALMERFTFGLGKKKSGKFLGLS
ncbi:hypothetical protein QC763_103850 [Podospora pseudopauciseta]|uniref:Ubiquitin carboxyl-terminal hydrolase n=1 Tax=Podospora pseudopauciseta TaxID=2093780 RepID=A0ABR0HXB6_9PEZI|nr:hypothetical protein QC763_103850 [Podospora pseudopauciseta]